MKAILDELTAPEQETVVDEIDSDGKAQKVKKLSSD